MDDVILHQDLSEKAEHGGVYLMRLLFRGPPADPPAELLMEKLSARFGAVEAVAKAGALRTFALTEHPVRYADGQSVPSQLMLAAGSPLQAPPGDPLSRTQFWDVPNTQELLEACTHQVLLGDFLARGLLPRERAEILSDWLELALELFPDCAAVYIEPSGKLLTAGQARENPYRDALRFIYFGVNIRFFNIEGTQDSMVDTLGLYALGFPDVQYHFHTLSPNAVVRHAANVAIYQFENDAPIEKGDTIAGILDSERWRCQYEQALIQPVRVVLDVDMGEYAAGGRSRSGDGGEP